MTSVLFICLGNICRSPAAEGTLRHLSKTNPSLANMNIQSCGTGDWHVGKLPDLRMQEAAKRRGIVLNSRAQHFKSEFLDQFDYILCADHSVLNSIFQHAKNTSQKAKVHLITLYSKRYPNEEVPDPYFGGDESFEHALNIIEDSCEGLLEHIIQKK